MEARAGAYPGLWHLLSMSKQMSVQRDKKPPYLAYSLVPLQEIYVQEEESRLQQHSRAKRSLA